MAWNDILAKDDPRLGLDVYYLRANIIGGLLSRAGAMTFTSYWDYSASSTQASMLRSRFAGELVADLVKVHALEEISDVRHPESGWFVHSGPVRYTRGAEQRTGTIELDGGDVTAVVRTDCEVTATASVNMQGTDNVSFVVGRLLDASRFDIVAAGYRRPSGFFAPLNTPEIPMTAPGLFPPNAHAQSDEDLLKVMVFDALEGFTQAVQTGGAWKGLYEGGVPAHETKHQAAFCLLARLTFQSVGIVTHPHADHGSGPTDLTLQLGRVVHVVEFKKDTKKSEVLHGLLTQLPRYVESVQANSSSYVILCHLHDPKEVKKWLPAVVPGRGALVCLIDCRKRESASKA